MKPVRYSLFIVLALFPLIASSLALPIMAAQSPQIPLPGSAIPQFVDPLPALHTIVAGNGQIQLAMEEFKSPVMPSTFVPAAGTYNGTWVWGYKHAGQTATSYIGPVIVAQRGTPTEIKFINNLGSAATTNVLAYKYSTDQTLHWADPLNQMVMGGMIPQPGSVGASNYNGTIPAVPHLHGGEVPPVLDGGPDAWFTSDGSVVGHGYYSKDGNTAKNYAIYRYPNTQEAAPIWFHDHTLGVTRLNVYAGLAGAYLLTDPPNDPTNLPQLVPLVVQDRMFDTNGQLFFPADSAGGVLWNPNPEHPYWVPEFVGDTIVVNGEVWPYLQVQAKRYRFILLNGSNARTYELNLPGVPFWVIGTDGGYLDKPVKANKITMQPGERYDVIIDFAPLAGTNVILNNNGRTPYPKGTPPNGATVGRIIQFRVGAIPAGGDTSYNPALGTALRSPMVRLVNPATGSLATGVTAQKTRQLTLNEVMGMPQTAINPVTGILTKFPGGPLEILVNNTKWDGTNRTDFTPVTVGGHTSYYSELPKEGETEIWEFVNLTADAHPIHLHLVQFQILNRQWFNVSSYTRAYNAAFPGGGIDPMTGLPYPVGIYMPGFGPPLNYNTGIQRALGGNPDIVPYLQGRPNPPVANEAGWKDTVIAYPGEVTRIAVRWAPTDLPANTATSAAFYPFDPNGGHGYVWHCHIIDHEDNEMMRPDLVIPISNATRILVKGTDY